jgi:HK97 family phage major capsid protein
MDVRLSGGSYRSLQRAQREQRALSVGTTTAGGFTVPQGFVYNLELALLQYGGVRQVADVMRTDSGNDMPWPTVNDTANVGELLSENTTVGSSVDPTFGQVVLKAYKYSSKLVLVSREILEDSAFNVAETVGKMLGERIGRIQNVHFTTGDNSAKPQGVVVASTLGVTAASATAIAADELFNLQHSVDPAYRQDPSCGWMMHDNILLAVRKLKDSQNRYLWEPSIQMGVPDKLLNYPITVNQQMQSSIATATRTMLFGALGKYKVRDVKDVRLMKLEERYADLDQVGFVAFLRSDGRMLNAGTNPVKHLVQA